MDDDPNALPKIEISSVYTYILVDFGRALGLYCSYGMNFN